MGKCKSVFKFVTMTASESQFNHASIYKAKENIERMDICLVFFLCGAHGLCHFLWSSSTSQEFKSCIINPVARAETSTAAELATSRLIEALLFPGKAALHIGERKQKLDFIIIFASMLLYLILGLFQSSQNVSETTRNSRKKLVETLVTMYSRVKLSHE